MPASTGVHDLASGVLLGQLKRPAREIGLGLGTLESPGLVRGRVGNFSCTYRKVDLVEAARPGLKSLCHYFFWSSRRYSPWDWMVGRFKK